MTLQSDRGKQLSDAARATRSTPEARRVEVLFDVCQRTLDEFQRGERAASVNEPGCDRNLNRRNGHGLTSKGDDGS